MNTSKPPLISVLLPTYNGAATLAHSIDSILAQDYPNFELIISDDCSSDDSAKIAAEYAQKHSNITLHVNKERLGMDLNVCSAAQRANGDFVHFGEQDDEYRPTFLSSLSRHMQAHPDATAVTCKHMVMRRDGTHCYDMEYKTHFRNPLTRAFKVLEDVGNDNVYGEIFLTGIVRKEIFIDAIQQIGKHYHSQVYAAFYALTGPLYYIDAPLKIKYKTKGSGTRHNVLKTRKARWYYPFLVSSKLVGAAFRSPHVPLLNKIGSPVPVVVYLATRILKMPHLKIRGLQTP